MSVPPFPWHAVVPPMRDEGGSPTSLSRHSLGEGGSKLRWGPEWNNLRADPRFQKLITDAETAMKAQATK